MLIANIYTDHQKEMGDKEKEIFSHPAWYGDLPGIECEDYLRGRLSGSYLIREGERRFQYYLSFVIGDSFTFKHQPFLVSFAASQTAWGYHNGCYHWASTLENLIPIVLHCAPSECYPILKNPHGK